jgi:hypothetical protein
MAVTMVDLLQFHSHPAAQVGEGQERQGSPVAVIR